MNITKGIRTPAASAGRRLPARAMTSVRRWPAAGALAAALLATVPLATGCSSDHSAPGGQAGHQLTQSQSDEDMVSFAQCMRDHGVQMSDPVHRPGHAGLSIDMPPQDGATRTAYAACNHFIAPIVQMKNAGAAAQAAPHLAALTRYAECMRAHDITMLDPNPQGELNLGRVPGMASNDFGRYSPQFRSADAACRHLLPAGVTDDGTGP
jgi:hypothetical protein